MATKNVGVRVEEENVDKFNQAKASFVSASAFANWIIEAFDREQQAKAADAFKNEIDAAAHAVEALMNSVKRMSTLAVDTVNAKDIQIQTTLSNKDIQIKELEEAVASGEIALSEKEDELTLLVKSKEEELKSQNAELKEVQKQLKETQDLLAKVQAELVTTQDLNTLLKKDQASHEAIEAKNKELVNEVTSLKEQLSIAQKTSDEHLKSLNEERRNNEILVKEHAKELEIAAKEKELAVSQAIANETTKAQTALTEQLKNEERTLRENSMLKDTIADMKKEQVEIAASHAEQINALNKRIAELEKDNTTK